MQPVLGWLRTAVNRAVYALLNPGAVSSLAAYVQDVVGRLSPAELQRVRRAAVAGIETAARATALQPGQTLREALGRRRAPAPTVRVVLHYEVELEDGTREGRHVTLGGPGDPGGPISWDADVAEVRARLQALHAAQHDPRYPGTIDWDTVEFVAPLRYP